MRSTFDVKMQQDKTRPEFWLMVNGNPVYCMLDTGSGIPVWCSGLERLRYLFPDATSTGRKFLLGGFGEGAAAAEVYAIPTFRLGGITFKHLLVAMDAKCRFDWDIILSYTVFSKLDYAIINTEPGSPLLRITHDRDIYGTAPIVYNDQLIKGISAFAAE